MNRLVLVLSALFSVAGLSACSDSAGSGGYDLGPDLALPVQVTHVGVDKAACCIETTSTAPRVMYISNPQPGGSDLQGNDVPTKGELHLADAYGFDTVLAAKVPRNSYAFTPDGQFIFYLTQSTADVAGESTYGLSVAPLSTGTIGTPTSTVVIPRGLDHTPLSQQAFFSPSGRFLIIGVAAPGVSTSTDLTIVEIETGKVVFTLPNGSFDYVENVTSTDIMVFENSQASRTPGKPSVEGLYVVPLAGAAAGAQPSLIETHTTNYTITPDERYVVYGKIDGTVWRYGLHDQTRVQLASDVVSFTLGGTSKGPLVYISSDLSIHVGNLLTPEKVHTAARSSDPWTSFQFSPDGQILYYFDRTSTQDATGDMFYLDLRDGHTDSIPHLIDQRVSQADVTFGAQRMRYIRNVDGRADAGELVNATLLGEDKKVIAEGVALGSLSQANPFAPTSASNGRSRGPVDMTTPITPPVFAQVVNAHRDPTATNEPLFDSSQPVIGELAFARNDEAPAILDSTVHVGSFTFSADGYVLVWAGDTKLDTTLQAYLGTIHLFQTLVDRNPTPPMLTGVSEIGRILDRGFFAAAPGASPAGIYFIRY